MALNTNAIHFRFESDAVDPSTFEVVQFAGSDSISDLYAFTIELASTDGEIDLGALSREAARLVLAVGEDAEYKIHGILSECHETGRGQSRTHYRVVLVPRLWLTSLQVQNQVHQNQTIQQTLEEELQQSGFVKDEDFAIHLSRTDYPEREYIVQYQESDLDFVRRQMEHYGIFFYFEQGEEKEKLIIADSNSAFPSLLGGENVPFRPQSGTVEEQEYVYGLTCTQNRMPNKVILSDYNYRTPSVRLRAEHVVSTDGRGIVSRYGDHFKTPEEGQALAEIRAQEILSREKIFTGNASVMRFHAGAVFTLDDHPRPDVSGHSYLLTSVHHAGSQPTLGESGEDSQSSTYSNSFTCIPSATTYRPPLTTPKPKVYGVLHAKVDAAGSGQYAELDTDGRYKVKVGFDLTDSGDGQASRFMRKAEHYAGAGYGQHFPLHKDSEVMLACVNADPDRPYIASAMANPEQASPVNASNQRTNTIRSASGNLIELDDTESAERIKMSCPQSNTYFHLGAANADTDGFVCTSDGQCNLVFQDIWNTEVYNDRKDYTDGMYQEAITGDHIEDIDQNDTIHVKGERKIQVDGGVKWLKKSNDQEVTFGNKQAAVFSNSQEAKLANANSLTVGTSIDLKESPLAFSQFFGINIGVTHGLKFSHDKARSLNKQDADSINAVTGFLAYNVGRNASFDVSNQFLVGAREIELSGDSKVTISVGGSSIEITSSKITLKASKVEIDGELDAKQVGQMFRNALKAS